MLVEVIAACISGFVSIAVLNSSAKFHTNTATLKQNKRTQLRLHFLIFIFELFVHYFQNRIAGPRFVRRHLFHKAIHFLAVRTFVQLLAFRDDLLVDGLLGHVTQMLIGQLYPVRFLLLVV